ncbi:hypothetical protein [Eisenibacter elegans]|jgi:hypothetical protein|nr:hypothetical protein [Eisenibacter elegans]
MATEPKPVILKKMLADIAERFPLRLEQRQQDSLILVLTAMCALSAG